MDNIPQWLMTAAIFGAGLIAGWLIELFIDWQFWNRQNRVLKEENAQLQGALNRSLNDKATSEQQMGRTLRRAEMAEEKVSNLHHQLKAVDDQRISLDEELTQISVRLRQMTAVEQANETLRNKLTTTEMRIRDLESEHSLANAKLSTEQARIQVVDEEASTLRTSLDNTEIELERLSQEKAILRQRLADTEAELATRTAQLENVGVSTNNDETTELRLQLEHAHQQIQMMQMDMDAAPMLEVGGGGGDSAAELELRIESLESELLNENNKLVSTEVKLQNLADALTDERMRAQMLEKQLAERPEEAPARMDYAAQQEALEQENSELRRRLAMAEQARAQVQQAAPRVSTRTSRVSMPAQKDKLQAISGIGNVFAQRLNAANIFTYAQLAQVAPEQLREIVQAKEFQQIDTAGWIEQARSLAGS